jgi:hypothetical protein
MAPDGGMWSVRNSDGKPLVIAEAKRQGPMGNAIERWYKNQAIAKRLNVPLYVTFCSGDGFFDGNSAQRTMELAVCLDGGGRERIENESVWNSPVGNLWMYRYRTTGEAADIESVLQEALETVGLLPTQSKDV